MQLLYKLRPLFLSCIFFSFQILHAQTTIDALLELPVEDIPVFDTTRCPNCILLKISFGTAEFQNLDVLKRFREQDIDQVEMVYSDFSRTPGFNQTALNRERLEKLQTVANQLFTNEDIRWSVKRQTDCHSFEQCSGLFHGFVVHLLPGKAKKDKDGTLIPVIPDGHVIIDPLRTCFKDTIIQETRISLRENKKTDCVYTGKYIPNDRAKAKRGIRYDKKGKGRHPEKKCTTTDYGLTYDTTYVNRTISINCYTHKPKDRSAFDRENDITVKTVMEQNWEKWKNEKVIVVQDVTGSMSSYLTQILIWHEQSAKNGVQDFIFFNDGDNKPDAKKKVGSTGGIYYIHSSMLSEIQEKANEAMRGGFGGDTPENNVEACIYAQKKCPDCTMILMIADNYAPVRDISITKKIKIPVHAIVCGGNGEKVHSDYLTIAALTDGSVHTSKLNLDLNEKAVEGNILVLGDREYIFSKGRYIIQKK